MKVYITYDRYEHNEWFYIYQITDKINEVRKDYKNNLKDFISYGPDDCHSYQIQVVNLTKDMVDKLKTKVQEPIEFGDDLYDIMRKIYENCDLGPNTTNCLLFTDGCSDNVEVVYFYLREQGLYDDSKTPEELEDLYREYEDIVHDEDIYLPTLEKYIDQTY